MRAHLAWIAVWLAGLFACGCAPRIQFPSFFDELQIGANLYVPAADAPLPAVVLLAPCSGVAPYMAGWAQWLRTQGYATLIVDSYAARGHANACLGGSPNVVDLSEDALAALRYLKSLPGIDPDRLAVMGWSHGGSAALQLDAVSRAYRAERAASIIAIYPGCETLSRAARTPMLLLLAGRDDWTPPDKCVSLGRYLQAQGRPVSWKVYEDASHFFDLQERPREYLGHFLYYDPSATTDAHIEVQKFLGDRLKR